VAISPPTVEVSLGDTGARSSFNVGAIGQTNGSLSTTWTPPGNALLLVGVNRSRATAGNTPTISDSVAQVSWSAALDQTPFDTIASPLHFATWFWGITPASPAAMFITVDFAGDVQTGCSIMVASQTGTHLTTPIVQSKAAAANSAASVSVTLDSALGSGSVTVSFGSANVTSAITPRTNWTEPANGEITYTAPATILEVQGWTTGETTASFTVAAGSNVAIVNIEVQPPASSLTAAQISPAVTALVASGGFIGSAYV